MSPIPKFELRKAKEGRVYKIWHLVYRIVQNEFKIMIYFSLLKSVFRCGGGDMHLRKNQKMIFLRFSSAKRNNSIMEFPLGEQ